MFKTLHTFKLRALEIRLNVTEHCANTSPLCLLVYLTDAVVITPERMVIFEYFSVADGLYSINTAAQLVQ